MDPLADILLPKLPSGAQLRGQKIESRCPNPGHGGGNGDSNPSLSAGRGTSQPVVIHCHAGCDPDDILAALGLTWADLGDHERDRRPKGEWTPQGEALAVYDYTDESGNLLFQVCRAPDKQFPQRVPDASRKSGWRWSLGDTRRVIYRLPKVIESVADGETIYIAEGEKDVHALEAAGVVATCNPGGAGKWRPEFAEFLRDARVRIIADKDKPGQAHARQVASTLRDVALTVEIAEAAEGKDAADHLAAGLTTAQFEVTCPAFEDEEPELAPDLYEFISIIDPPNSWVIPDILERGDRLIWTGYEGLGKSVMTRMLAVAAAAGVHPFTGEPTEPQRVLFIDCENPDRKSRRHFTKLEQIARKQGFPVPQGILRILQKPSGVDLTRDEDRMWLTERVTAHKPDLLVVGPFYRLHAADANEESAARLVVSALDEARLKNECALVTEAHAGHGEGGNRSVRPTGSSLLMRWPEFGYGMKPKGDADEHGRHHTAVIVPWRGPREERYWPREITWGVGGMDWPWVPAQGLKTPGLRRSDSY